MKLPTTVWAKKHEVFVLELTTGAHVEGVVTCGPVGHMQHNVVHYIFLVGSKFDM